MQKTFFLCLTLVWVGVSSLVAQSGNDLVNKVDRLESEAKARLAEDKSREAEALLDDAIQLMPLRASLYHHRAFARLDRKNIDGMFDDLYKAVRLDPENPEYYYWRGYFLNLARKDEDAIKDFSKGLTYVEEGDSLYYMLLEERSKSRLDILELEGAMEDAKLVLVRDTNDVALLNSIGIILTQMDRAGESVPYFRRALELEPENINLVGNVGWGYLCLGEYDEALVWYNRMVDENPKAAYGYSNRGYLKIKMGDLKGAEKDLKKAIKLDERNSYAYKNRALLFIEKEDYEQACEELNLAEQYGFTKQYGPEVKELKEKHCQ
ncbi:MAG: tetratricopeptide repeat protein [Bacteroidota bacterium]